MLQETGLTVKQPASGHLALINTQMALLCHSMARFAGGRGWDRVLSQAADLTALLAADPAGLRPARDR